MNQAKFTRGPVKIGHTITDDNKPMIVLRGFNGDGNKVYDAMIEGPDYAIAGVGGVGYDECLANSQLIVAAFNSATAAQDMGFDGIKAVEALPGLLKVIQGIQHNAQVMNQAEPNRVLTAIDDACRKALAQAGQLTKSQENALAAGPQKPRW